MVKPMESKCYLCDSSCSVPADYLQLGLRREPICSECVSKTANRKAAKQLEHINDSNAL